MGAANRREVLMLAGGAIVAGVLPRRAAADDLPSLPKGTLLVLIGPALPGGRFEAQGAIGSLPNGQRISFGPDVARKMQAAWPNWPWREAI